MAHRSFLVPALLLSLAAAACGASNDAAPADDADSAESDLAASAFKVTRTDLVSDQAGVAATQDKNLVNPWGMAFNDRGGVWVSNNHSATSTVYDADGKLLLTVTVPTSPSSTEGGAPTGQVFNTTTDFNGDKFIFADEGGTISGWQPTPGTVLRNDQTTAHAGYKGLAQADHKLFATDFHNAKIDTFDSTYKLVPTTGFVDASMPRGYAPFNIQNLDGKLYVTYALQDDQAEDDVQGSGRGFVNVFDTDGTLIGRVASRGALNAPWGLSIAPATAGKLAGKLLVGNFGGGQIHAYDVAFGTSSSGGGSYGGKAKTVTTVTGRHLGALRTQDGKILSIPALWGLAFSPATGDLFFTAGPGDENHGLFGKIALPTGK